MMAINTDIPNETPMQRVLVAGATGYLGGYVVRELHQRGHVIRALTRSPEKLGRVAPSCDEVAVAEITRPETLEGVCDGIDVVFSSVGITKQRDGLSFHDVDYQGNRNLLDAAIRAGVKRFVYVSVFGGATLRHLEIVDAHERFVDALGASGMPFAVLRPTGYFSDMAEILEMARRGRVWLIGSGHHRMNPIHGEDLAVACADAIEGSNADFEVGGPETLTWESVATAAFDAIGKHSAVTRLPEWLMWSAVRLVRLFDRHQGELLAFFTTMATMDVVAPASGKQTLGDHFRRLGVGS